jgi:hypothetical protein
MQRLLSFLLLLLLPAIPVAAGAFSYSGMFTQDDDVTLIPFTVTAGSLVTIQTWSFGGGVNANGDTIAAGGSPSPPILRRSS